MTLRLDSLSRQDDRYATAVGLLASDDREIRVGGLLALEKLARERTASTDGGWATRYSLPVHEVLMQYIRERSRPEAYFDHLPKELATDLLLRTESWLDAWVANSPPQSGSRVPPTTQSDVQLVLKILNRNGPLFSAGRNEELQRAHPAGWTVVDPDQPLAESKRALLTDVDLSGCWLNDVDLSGATLVNVPLEGACLLGAEFGGATLEQVSFDSALIGLANFELAHLLRCGFMYAHVIDCKFGLAEIVGSHFDRAQLSHTSFWTSRRGSGLAVLKPRSARVDGGTTWTDSWWEPRAEPQWPDPNERPSDRERDRVMDALGWDDSDGRFEEIKMAVEAVYPASRFNPPTNRLWTVLDLLLFQRPGWSSDGAIPVAEYDDPDWQ